MRPLLFISVLCIAFSSCKKKELPDAEPVAIIDESITLHINAKRLAPSGALNPLLGNTITLYLSEEDRQLEDNVYYEATTNTAGTATFTEVLIGDHIYLSSTTSDGDIEFKDFLIGNILIKNVEILHN